MKKHPKGLISFFISLGYTTNT